MGMKIRIQLDSAGIQKFLKSDELRADVERRTSNIAAAAGEGFKHKTWPGRDRWRGRVETANQLGAVRESESRALTRAMNAGRN